MRPCYFPPDHPDLRAPDLARGAVDVGDALAEVEAGGLGGVDAFCEGGLGNGSAWGLV